LVGTVGGVTSGAAGAQALTAPLASLQE